MQNQQNDDKRDVSVREAILSPYGLRLRAILYGGIALLFLFAFLSSYIFADQPTAGDAAKQQKLYSTPSELASASTAIDKVFSTLPKISPLTYTAASDTCAERVNGKERIICPKGYEFARLNVRAAPQQTPLEISDALASRFSNAGWQKTRYIVKTASGKELKRADADTKNYSLINLVYSSPKTNGKIYCAGFVHNPDQKPAWSGTLAPCDQQPKS